MRLGGDPRLTPLRGWLQRLEKNSQKCVLKSNVKVLCVGVCCCNESLSSLKPFLRPLTWVPILLEPDEATLA